jgi:hypothetical protein
LTFSAAANTLGAANDFDDTRQAAGGVMALAMIVTLEREIPELETYTKAKTGKALAREADRLSLAARTVKVPVLGSMLSENQAKLIEQLKADGFDPARMRLPPEQWYPATEGLITVRKLIDHVAANLNDFKQPNPILRDLRAVEKLLAAAESAGVRFHYSNAEL